ncbi:MAG: phosphate ABC transporter permease subunit PstC [Leptotrichiaceae bacterium]|nr:phosphate ABC transporter permease subunit PstC [Leptotrichiaceae bacterium]
MNKFKENIAQAVFLIIACISILSVFLICIFLFSAGFPAIFKIGITKFLFGMSWKPLNDIFGIFPMIIGSIYVTLGALIIGVPLGIMTAIYISYFCPEKWYNMFKRVINLMAGIPSVVYGFFGLVVLVPFIREYIGGRGMGVLTTSILLGVMILPTIISVSETSLKAVPRGYYSGGLALGASHERVVFFIVLPAAKRGILASIILGVGRAIGETMAVVMVAGNQAIIPKSLVSGVRTLTTNIVMEMGYSTDLHREALIGTAVVLFVFILIINTIFYLIYKKEVK